MSFPKTPSRPLVADVLFTFVMPFEPLPIRETPLIPGPLPSLSYSMQGEELVQVGSITPGDGLLAATVNAAAVTMGIASRTKRNRFIFTVAFLCKRRKKYAALPTIPRMPAWAKHSTA